MLLAYGHSKVLSLDDSKADFRELTANHIFLTNEIFIVK
jgi:hypothetical protein